MVQRSPITENKNIRLIKKIDAVSLINQYYYHFKIDISYLIKNNNIISVYECQDTKYRFFYPYEIAGDGIFYEELQKFDWYYMPWKWEHQHIIKLINPGLKLLEVGAAKGSFIKEMSRRGLECTGLELNKSAVEEANKNKINLLFESIQEHSQNNKNSYDIVCSFQVLEHIAEVDSFIKAQIDCLKVNGRLIISVPNNDSFLGRCYSLLNLPPHHMGLWNKKSLTSLEIYFPIKLEKIIHEPLQSYHVNWYQSELQNEIQKFPVFRSFYFRIKIISRVINWMIKRFRKFIKGHTIIAIYKKTDENPSY